MPKDNTKSRTRIFKKLIYNDKYLMIFALVLAVLIWIFTSLSIGTEETKTIKMHVPINLSSEISEQLGMQYYSLNDTVDLSVTISGAKYVVGQVKEDDLNVSFDTSNINRTGEQSVPIIVTNGSKSHDFDVSSVYPASVQCYLDASSSKTFDVSADYDESRVADGYYFGSPVLSEEKVIVTGPKTFVDKIDNVGVTVDFGDNTDITEMYNANCSINISGAGVYDSYLTVTSRKNPDKAISSISVALPVLKNATLPVSVQYEDMPHGFSQDTLIEQYSVSTISAGVLDSTDITSAVIGTVNFADLNVGKNVFTFDVTNLSGIALSDDSIDAITATITVPSTYQTQGIAITPQMVDVKSASKDYTYTIQSLSAVQATVVLPRGTSIRNSDLSLTCDLTSVTQSGTYPVTITVKDKDNMWVYGQYNASVVVKKQ